MSFKSLGLSKDILEAIEKKGYDKPSVIQEKAIPLVLEGKDVLASAQTGTGKTAGFTLPLLEILSKRNSQKRRPIRALVLTPTRELAAQVLENVREYSEFLDIRSTVIFGGVKQGKQVAALRQGVDVLVATPGRLLDLIQQNIISLKQVEVFVLDEADRMLDMGFLRDIQRVIKLMPREKQNLMFSATFSKDIRKLAESILNNPVSVEAAPKNTTAEKVNQKIFRVNKKRKTELIIKQISEGNWKQVLVFTRTKHGANKLTEKMNKAKITAAAIHGNKSQGARTKALKGFKDGSVRVMVATDIAARGLDIPLLPYVINFELPNVAEDYVHRIGRTGRAGASGQAISLVCSEEMEYVFAIEKLLKDKLPYEIIEGFEPTEDFENPPPAPKQGGGRNKGPRGKNFSRRSGGGKGNGGNKSGFKKGFRNTDRDRKRN